MGDQQAGALDFPELWLLPNPAQALSRQLPSPRPDPGLVLDGAQPSWLALRRPQAGVTEGTATRNSQQGLLPCRPRGLPPPCLPRLLPLSGDQVLSGQNWAAC